jgi:hypothetical protein
LRRCEPGDVQVEQVRMGADFMSGYTLASRRADRIYGGHSQFIARFGAPRQADGIYDMDRSLPAGSMRSKRIDALPIQT